MNQQHKVDNWHLYIYENLPTKPVIENRCYDCGYATTLNVNNVIYTFICPICHPSLSFWIPMEKIIPTHEILDKTIVDSVINALKSNQPIPTIAVEQIHHNFFIIDGHHRYAGHLGAYKTQILAYTDQISAY